MNLQALVETCLHNFLTNILAKMGITECITLAQLKKQDEHAEKLITRNQAEAGGSKP